MYAALANICNGTVVPTRSLFSAIQSPRTLREAETKKARCSVFRQRPLMYSRLLDVDEDASIVAKTLDAES